MGPGGGGRIWGVGGEKNAHTRLSLTLEVEHCFQGLEVLYTGTTTTKTTTRQEQSVTAEVGPSLY